MPLAHQASAASQAMSIGILVVVVLLLVWLWYERRLRGLGVELSAEDATHFTRQDVRRGLVAVILGIVGLGIFADSLVEPRTAGRANPLFLLIWLSIFLLLAALPVLAAIDWLATRRYARRQIRALAQERMEILREELRLRSHGESGSNGPVDPLGDSATS